MKRRREILEAAGSAALMTAMAVTQAQAQTESLSPAVEESPKHHIRFGVCGISHDHIYGMIGAIQRGGGELVSFWGAEPDRLADFARRYPGARQARSQDEVLHDASLQLVMSSHIASERAAIGIKAMKAGKDFLADKPGITTLKDLGLVRKTIAETGRIYAVLYSERLEVRAAVHAGELIRQGAIGKVIQTINIAPHQVIQRGGDNGGGTPRPDWFW